MNGNKIIVHTLLKTKDGYLVTKRSKQETTFPEYWDIPGGLADYGELPKEAAVRETKEETGLDIIPTIVIHEDSNLDKTKNLIFIRLVYLCELKSNIDEITLQEELINEKISPFLIEVFNNLQKE